VFPDPYMARWRIDGGWASFGYAPAANQRIRPAQSMFLVV